MQKPPIQPKEVQSFSHHREEKSLEIPIPKKTQSEERPKKVTATNASFPKHKESAQKYSTKGEESGRDYPKPSLPYEKMYADDQRAQNQYYNELRLDDGTNFPESIIS